MTARRGNVKIKCVECGTRVKPIKCISCGKRIKPPRKLCPECKKQRRIQKDRRYNRSEKGKAKRKEYYEKKGKENYRKWYERNKEKCKENRKYHERNREKRREYEREYRMRNIKKIWEYRERHKDRIRQYQRQYRETRRPFQHTHDRTTDLTIENGRVKGAVWLESQIGKKSVRKNFWRTSFFQKSYEGALCSCGTLQTPFYIAEENHRTYCFECGGKFVIAFENDYYSITEVCCSFCGLVLPQTKP